MSETDRTPENDTLPSYGQSATAAGQDPNVKSNQSAGADPQAESPPRADELAEARKQRDEFLDQLQRTRAEFANYQKRAKAQSESDRIYAVGTLAKDLLDALDNLERATEALRASGVPGVTEGLDMVHKQLLAVLAKHGVAPINALGQPFDPNQHEALVQQPDDQHPEGTVIGELARGYRIHDRVLRPSKVAVSIKRS